MVTGLALAECTDLDRAEAATGVAIQISDADVSAPAARTASRKRCRAGDPAAADLSSAALE
jgi:hypothetical protein